MPRVLIVHHTPSPSVHSMVDQVRSGASAPEVAGVDLCVRPALTAGAADVLAADGYLLVAPANLGYMAGALKHFFDVVYYPCLDATVGRPYGVAVHGNDDTTGALLSVEKVVKGLGWRAVAAPVSVVGHPGSADLSACFELGATVAATVATGID